MNNKNITRILLEIKNLEKSFKGEHVLKDLDFSISTGEIVSMMGPSGIGKITFINILLGLDK